VSIGVPVPSGRGRLRRSGLPRPGPERPAGHGKADANLDQLTSCSQNQIRQDCYLAWGEPRFADGGPAGRGRPPQAATRRAGLEVVEKLLTSITSGSGLAFGQATSRSSWISLSLTADMRDQGLTQLLLGELVA
jgi:hypothetical protein